MKEKVMILAIHYDQKDKAKLQPILDEMYDVSTKIDKTLGVIWKPYNGTLEKVYGVLDDLQILNLTKEERHYPNKLVQQILIKRCNEAQQFLDNMNPETDIDVAYSLLNHFTKCPICQEYASQKYGIDGTYGFEFFVKKRLKGETP